MTITACGHSARKGIWPMRLWAAFLLGNRRFRATSQLVRWQCRKNAHLNLLHGTGHPVPIPTLFHWQFLWRSELGGLQSELWAGPPDSLFISEALSTPILLGEHPALVTSSTSTTSRWTRWWLCSRERKEKAMPCSSKHPFYKHLWKEKFPSYLQTDRKG